MDVIIAIQFGIRHTSNACMIKHDQPNEFEEFNVVFDTKSNTQLQTKSHTTPTYFQPGEFKRKSFLFMFTNHVYDRFQKILLP